MGQKQSSAAASPIRKNIGDMIHITKKVVPGTGYSWRIVTSFGIVQTNEKDLIQQDRVPGQPYKKQWTFRFIEPGKQFIQSFYERPWEKQKTVADFSESFLVSQ